MCEYPCWTLHAIGGGILLAEIQQASDVTYVYDYDRIDAKKGSQESFIKMKLLMLLTFLWRSLIDYETSENSSVSLVESDYFSTHLIHVNEITLVKTFLRMHLVFSLVLR